jgi:hypothetical protein
MDTNNNNSTPETNTTTTTTTASTATTATTVSPSSINNMDFSNINIMPNIEMIETLTNIITNYVNNEPNININTDSDDSIFENKEEEDTEGEEGEEGEDEYFNNMDMTHIVNNIFGNQGNLFNMMFQPAINPVNPVNAVNAVNPANPVIINEINPANSINTVLPPIMGVGGNQPLNMMVQFINPPAVLNAEENELINTEVEKLLKEGMDDISSVSETLLNFIESCYLNNMQYDDDIDNLFLYTIRNCFVRGRNFELKEIISGIIYYSFCGNNLIFSDNYDNYILPILQNELKRIVTQSIRLSMLQRLFNPTMEDVKLTIDEKTLEKIPVSKYVELEDKIKKMNVCCTVCQDDFKTEDTVRILPCEHIYHTDCIDGWLKEHSYKCPCCRKPAAEYKPKI